MPRRQPLQPWRMVILSLAPLFPAPIRRKGTHHGGTENTEHKIKEFSCIEIKNSTPRRLPLADTPADSLWRASVSSVPLWFGIFCLALTVPMPAAPQTPRIPLHHRLSVHVEPRTGAIDATDEISVDSPTLTSFTLARGLSVDKLLVDGTAMTVDSDAGRWELKLADRAAHQVTVRYHGKPAATDPAATALLIDPQGTFLTGDGWYPTFDVDELSYELSVEVPAGQLAVAPGKVLSERSGTQRYTVRVASEGPVEGIALFAGPYRMTERRHHGLRLRTYFDPAVADLAALYLEKTAHYIDFYEHWIGPYPYSTFAIVSGQQPFGLGFPGLTYIGSMVLRLPFVPATSLGHEVLHNWWGNAVQVDASQGNWAEGLTTFMADYTYAEREGEAAAREMRRRWMRAYAALPPAREQPLTAFRSRYHSASQVVGYHKAAMVFLMLRDEIGRDAYDRGIHRFWRRNRFRRAGWIDLQRAFEAAAGRSLAGFFSQWIERTGAPRLEVRDLTQRKVDSSFALSFVITQPEPAYHLRVPVEIHNARGDAAESVRLDATSQPFEIRAAQRAESLCVDPDFRLFRRPLPGEVAPIVRSVVFDSEAPAVIAAQDPQAREAAQALARQLLERAPRLASAGAALPDGPVLLVGTDAEVKAFLDRQKLPGAPSTIAGRGTARAWAIQRDEAGPLVVVAARDAAALQEIAGPLPHYGSDSFIVFDGRRTIDHGVWPAGPSPLCTRLDTSD
jgi:aminopeptidase N